MNYSYYNPVKTIFGDGCVLKNAAEFAKLGESCLIVTSGTAAKKSGALGDVTAALDSQKISYMLYDKIEQNPTMVSCMEAGKIARDNKLEFVVGIGGGSPLDASKAAAVYAANDMTDGLDIYKMDWKNAALPIVAIGTTAGTGSEVTAFSILTMPNGRKKSFGNEQTYPRLMFGDYRYTSTLPLNFTKSTALDALAHALEAYFNVTANDITDIYAIQSTTILFEQLNLLKSMKSGDEITASQRERLYFASIVAGLALSQCGTVYCHFLGYHFTENYGVPHGFACAATLPDLIKRAEKCVPERAAKFFEATKISSQELIDLINDLTELPEIKLTTEAIAALSNEGATTKNFMKTIENGITANDSIELLTKLFS